ncbi:hypothetical protein [Flavobacterium sp.]|uniref:hypothetical protein n=1 Tax=Flavobacterium sp. TaxID=239 RepID=UPI0039E5CB9D
MRKTQLLIAGMLTLAITLTSCSSEDKAVQQQENARTVELAKTTEMLDFESSLKDWMQAKRENVGTTSRAAADEQIARQAKALLGSIGENETASKEQTTDELVRATMRAYSKKLTEQYRAQNQ